MVLLIVRGLLRRPSLSLVHRLLLFAQYTFTMSWLRNVMHLLSSFSAYMDICGSILLTSLVVIFNMSALSTVGDVFTDEEFSAPGNSLLWGAWCTGGAESWMCWFLIMPKRPYEWRVHSHGCYKFDKALLGLGLRDQSAHLPVFLHLRNTNLPGPSSVMRSEQAQQRRFERRHDKERMQRRRS